MKDIYLKIIEHGREYFIPVSSFQDELSYFKVGDRFEVELVELDHESAEELNER